LDIPRNFRAFNIEFSLLVFIA